MAKKEITIDEIQQQQAERLQLGGIRMSFEDFQKYLVAKDDLGISTAEPPAGYKKCGGCGHIKKFYTFNKNTSNKNGCTGNCKECQRKSAGKSYKKTKTKRNYAKYYQENKEIKQAAAKKWYAENKDKADLKHRKYVSSAKGKKVMQKARDKRSAALEATAGIPYTRDLIIDRDKNLEGQVICYLCNKAVDLEDTRASHIDHVIGILIGGANCFSNVALVHDKCNLTKSKDCREVTAEITEDLIKRTNDYLDLHPELLD